MRTIQTPNQWLREALSWGVSGRGCRANQSFAPSTEINNKCSYVRIPSVRLHGTHRDFTFYVNLQDLKTQVSAPLGYGDTSLDTKGKAVPLQAWSGPEGSRKLRFPDFMTTQDSGKIVSLMHWLPLPPGNAPGNHFC